MSDAPEITLHVSLELGQIVYQYYRGSISLSPKFYVLEEAAVWFAMWRRGRNND